MNAHGAAVFSQQLGTVAAEASNFLKHFASASTTRTPISKRLYHAQRLSIDNIRGPIGKADLDRAAADATLLLKAHPRIATMTTATMHRSFHSSTRASSSALARSFRFVNHRRLNKLEQEANMFAQDPRRQAALYKEWLRAKNPQAVIARFERGNFAHDEECWQYYIAALAQTGQTEAILPRIMQKLETSMEGGMANAANNADHAIPGSVLQKLVASKTGKRMVSVDGVALPQGAGSKEQPIYVIAEEARKYMVWRAVRWVGVTLTYAFCILTLLSLVFENSGLLKTASSQMEYEPSNQQVVRFEDVQGVDEAKAELEELVQFLRDPQKFTELGGKLPKGVLLTGPPGTGKTMLARAVAGEAGVPFFFMSGSEFDEMYVGVGARRVRELFAAARSKAPSIVFIDEIDAIGSKRNPKDQSYMRQTLNQLLVDLDGFSQTEGVIFIAATNFPELLDKALVRPGRFDRHVNVPLPDVRGRIEILKHHTKNIQMDNQVDVSVVARGTPGFSGADLANLVNQAAIKATQEGCREVTLKHLEYAKDKIIMGAERRSAVITEESKKLTAYHEGGHALVAYYTPGAMPLHKATIMPRGSALGVTVQLPEMDKDSFTKREYLAQIDVCMGGRVAEEMVFGADNVTSGAHSDIVKATDVAKRMVRNYGMSDKVGPISHDDEDMQLLSTPTRQAIESEIKELVELSERRAKEILSTHRDELDRLAKALVEYETLTYEEIVDVLNGKPITR